MDRGQCALAPCPLPVRGRLSVGPAAGAGAEHVLRSETRPGRGSQAPSAPWCLQVPSSHRGRVPHRDLQQRTGHTCLCCHPSAAPRGMRRALLPSGLQAGPETWHFSKIHPVQSQDPARTRQQWCRALVESTRTLPADRGTGQGRWGWRGALLAPAIVSSWGAEPAPRPSPSPSSVTLREGGGSHPAHALPVALHQPQQQEERGPSTWQESGAQADPCPQAPPPPSPWLCPRGGRALSGWLCRAGQLRGRAAPGVLVLATIAAPCAPAPSGTVSPDGQELGQRPGAGSAVVTGYTSAVQCPLVLPGCSAAEAAQGTVCEQTSVSH